MMMRICQLHVDTVIAMQTDHGDRKGGHLGLLRLCFPWLHVRLEPLLIEKKINIMLEMGK
jgi:hypothetical protein